MAAVSWQAAADGRFWIDVNIAAQSVRVMIAGAGYPLCPGKRLLYALLV